MVHSVATHISFLFLILTLCFTLPVVYAETVTTKATAIILPPGEAGFQDDEIILDNDETIDLSQTVQTVEETTETIGGQEVNLTQQVQFVSNTPDNPITLQNIEETSILVKIPDKTKISAPAAWNGQLTPPTTVAVTGTVDAAFVAPTTGILFGSPDVILVFDKAVTIILEGTTGQTAYKLAGSNNWILIDGCTGIYANPTDPDFPNECSISNGIDTKIVTFHFTHFGPLEEDDPEPDPTPTPTTAKPSKGGGHGRTGVGPGSSSPGQVFVPVLPEGVLPEEGETKAIPVPSPTMSLKEQLSQGVAPVDIVCKSGLELHLKLDDTPMCIRESTFEALMKRGYQFTAA